MKIDSSHVNLSSVCRFKQYYPDTPHKGLSFSQRMNQVYPRPYPSQHAPTDTAPLPEGPGHGVSITKVSQTSFSQITQMLDLSWPILEDLGKDIPFKEMGLSYITPGVFKPVMITADPPPPEHKPPYRDASEVCCETATSFFTAEGRVSTQDGNCFDFTFELKRTRESYLENGRESIEKSRLGPAPLVMNLNEEAPALSKATIYFDLDADGKKETTSLLEKGSGFLTLDKNKDGIINDGSELFGASRGEGFKELAEYDLDRNGWIDENDAVFQNLTIWENEGNGKMRLVSLKEAGIGAIYLNNRINPFDLWETPKGALKTIRSSSVALHENGNVSGLHEMNWVL